MSLYQDVSHPQHVPMAPQSSAPGENEHPIKWDEHLDEYKAKLGITRNAKIMYAVGDAFAAIAAVSGKITVDLALYMTATPFVVLGTVSAAALVTLATSSVALYLIFKRSYDTPATLVEKDQQLIKDMLAENSTLVQIETRLAAYRSKTGSTLGLKPAEMAAIQNMALDSTTAQELIQRNGVQGVGRLAQPVKERLRKKYLKEITAEDHEGMKALRQANAATFDLLGVSDEMLWPHVAEKELDISRAKGFSVFTQRNGDIVQTCLSTDQRKVVGLAYISEVLATMKTLEEHADKQKNADKMNVGREFGEALKAWVETKTAGLSLLKRIENLGIEVLDFLGSGGSAEDPLIAAFITECDLVKHEKHLHILFQRHLIRDNNQEALKNRFLKYMKESHASWADARRLWVPRDLRIDLESVMPVIEDYETQLGYAMFVQRNGEEAFKHLKDSSKEVLRASYLEQIEAKGDQNPNVRFQVPRKGEDLGITSVLVSGARARWLAAQTSNGYDEFVRLNGTSIFAYLDTSELEILGSKYLEKPIVSLRGLQAQISIAKTLIVPAKFEAKLVAWVKANRTAATLKAQIQELGIELVNPLFLDKAVDATLIAGFVEECDLKADVSTLNALKPFLESAQQKRLVDRLKERVRDETKGWLQSKNDYSQFIQAFGVTAADIIPAIQEQECTHGYAKFVERNGREAVSHVSEAVRNMFRESVTVNYFAGKQINLDQPCPMPADSDILGITKVMMEEARTAAVRTEISELKNPTLQILIAKYGKGVLAKQYLQKGGPLAQAIVRNSLAAWDFEKDDFAVMMQFTDPAQTSHLSGTYDEIARQAKAKSSTLDKMTAERDAELAANKSKYNSMIEGFRNQYSRESSGYEQQMGQIQLRVEQGRKWVAHYDNERTVLQSKLAQTQNDITAQNNRLGQLNVDIAQALADQNDKTIVAQAQKTIDRILESLKQIPTTDAVPSAELLLRELNEISAREKSARDNSENLAKCRGDLEANLIAQGNERTKSLSDLEAEQIEAQRVTGAVNALVAIVPGSQHTKKLEEINKKIGLKKQQQTLEQEIARLSSLPMALSSADNTRKASIASELRSIEKASAVKERIDQERARLTRDKEKQEKIIADHRALAGKVESLKSAHKACEAEIQMLQVRARGLATMISSNESSRQMALPGLNRALAELKQVKTLAQARTEQNRNAIEAFTKNYNDSVAQSKTAYTKREAEVNARFDAAIAAVKDAFHNTYR